MSESRFALLVIHYQGDQTKKKDMGGMCSTYGGKDRISWSFGEETEVKTRPGKPRHRWEEKIEIYREEIGRKGEDWIDLKKTALFWAITQQVVVIPIGRFGTTC
jgi:hypothetical protein